MTPDSLKSNAESAFLDIETSWSGHITVIGVYRPLYGTRQLIWPEISKEMLLSLLKDAHTLFTYNGSSFDLPVIESQIETGVLNHLKHRDLLHECRRRGLRGGLKRVEQILDIHRDTEGVDGLAAMNLWERYHRHNDSEALEILLRYNREDVENLEILAGKMGLFNDPAPARFGSSND